MQVIELESNGLKKKIRVVVEAAKVNAQMDAELRAAGEKVKMPGFRPGYIPMKILQQRYGKSVQAEVVKQTINQATNDALAEKKLRPALLPQLNLEPYNEGGDLSFTMEFEAFPDINEPKFETITLERNTFDIPEKEIDDALERIALGNPKMAKAKAGTVAKNGHVVTIDFKGMIDGVAFEGGTSKDFQLELGSGRFIAGFEDQLVGAKEGDDKIVSVTFPDDYPGKEVAGKKASFEVKVKEVLEKETPAIDDAFAKLVGFDDVAKLRDAVRSQLSREYDQMVRNQLKKQLFDQLETVCDFELPQGMVDMEFNSIWERLKEARDQGDESVAGKSEDELKAEYRKIAERRVKLGLLLAEMGNRHKLQVTREELSRAVFQQASMFPGQEKQVMDYYRNNPERTDDLRGPILEEKAVDFILGKVKYDDKKLSLEELRASNDEMNDEGGSDAKPKKASKAKAAKVSEGAEDAEESAAKAKAKPAAKKKAASANE